MDSNARPLCLIHAVLHHLTLFFYPLFLFFLFTHTIFSFIWSPQKAPLNTCPVLSVEASLPDLIESPRKNPGEISKI